MAEVKHFIDQSSIQQDADFMKGVLDEILTRLDTINKTKVNLKSAGAFGQAINAAKQLSDEQAKLVDLNLKIAKTEKEYANAKLQSNKADTEAVKTKSKQADLEAKIAKEKERLISAAEKEAKAIEKANNEYVKLNNAYKEASAASLKRGAELLKEANGNEALYQSLLKTDKEYVSTTKNAKTFSDQLLQLEQNVGRSQRNVGNYASAFNGLNTSFARVAQELPSLNVSFQTFALAISNDLPIVAEEITRAKAAIAQLQSEGQKVPSIGQQVLKGVLSFQVGLSLLITAFVALAPKIAEFVSGMFQSGDAAAAATSRINQFAAAAAKSSGELSFLNGELDRYITLLGEQSKTKAGGDLDLLRAQLQISYQKETQAVKTRNEAWQEYLNIGKEITKLSIGKDFFGNIVDKEVPEEIKKQQDEVLKIYQNADKQVADELFSQQLIVVRINNQKIEDEKEKNEKLKQAGDELLRIRKKLSDDELEAQRELILFRLQQEADAQERTLNSERFTYDERINAANDFYKTSRALLETELSQELEKINQRAREAGAGETEVQNQKALVREQFNARFLELERSLSDNILQITKESISSEEKARFESYQKRIKAIQDFGALTNAELQKQRDNEILALNEQANATGMSFEEQKKKRLEIVRKYLKLELEAQIATVEKLATLETDPLKKAELEAQAKALRVRIDDELTQEKIDNLKTIEDRERKLADLQKQLQQEVFNLVKTFTLGRFDVAKNQIQDQIEASEEQKRKEIDSINATTLSATEKQARITNAEKRAQTERERLELRQRQVDTQRAKFERAFSIAQIVGKTAQAVAGYLAGLPATAPLIALVSAIGAAQVATVLAQPIPKFKTGKGEYDQYEGPAWVGDGGKSEMIFRENGSIEKTPSTPVLTWVGKNDIIHPDANALLLHSMAKQKYTADNAGNSGSFLIVADHLSKKLDHVGNQISSAIQNKREFVIDIKGDKMSMKTKDGNRWKTYLNNNLQFGK